MDDKDWKYIENQFLTVTRDSRKLMLLLIDDHDAKLQAQVIDADISTLYARTHPLRLDYDTKYAAWQARRGEWSGATRFINEKLDTLATTKIRLWQAQVGAIYVEGTANYQIAFPNGRASFTTGEMDVRINEVMSLSARLSSIGNPALTTIISDVNATFTDLRDTRNTQQGKENAVDAAADALETARVATARMMYRNLGRLMDKYGDGQAERCAEFYDLALIRDGAPEDAPPAPIPPVPPPAP